MHHPEAPRFLRTSYGLVPSRWRSLDQLGVRDRVLYALQLSYRTRNYQSSRSGDLAEMLWVALAFEFVEPIWMPPYIEGYEEDDYERVSVRADLPIHPDVIDAAIPEVIAQLYKGRPGLDGKPWNDAFSTFRYEEDGDMCHLVKWRERSTVFDAALGRDQTSPRAV